MPARKEIDSLQRLGIIAGSGNLPEKLLTFCHENGIETFMVGFENFTEQKVMEKGPHLWTNIGRIGEILGSFKRNNIHDLVLIGGLKRPKISELKLDYKGFKLLMRIVMRKRGDNNLLSFLKKQMELEGFTLHGIHDFCKELLAQEGVLGVHKPNMAQQEDIVLGFKASQDIGQKDIGQAVVVHNGKILGHEGKAGTDELIGRCTVAGIQEGATGPILVKSCKPQQERNLDLPTIGPQTIQSLHDAGFSGIAIHAGSTLIVDIKDVEELADRYNMFVVAISGD